MNDNNCIFFIDNVDKERINKNPFIDDDSPDSPDSSPNQNTTMNDQDQRIEQKNVSHVVPEIHSTPVRNSRRFFLCCCCNNKDTV